MSGLLIGILDMSISASCVALIVMLIRLVLRKAPKIYSYALWAVVFFRLFCTTSFIPRVRPYKTEYQPSTMP